MAYQVVVSPLVGVVFDKLKSLIQNKFGESRDVQKEMKKLSRTLSSIKDVLDDAEEKQVAVTGIHEWLKELKDAAYKAEDVLEEWAFRDQQLEPEKVTDSLKELMESFDVLAGDMVRFHLQCGISQTRPEISPDRETGHLLTEPIVYGRDEDRAELVKLLCPPDRSLYHHPNALSRYKVNSQEDMLVCPILGMGGLGKTTLAQLVYNDSQVVRRFQSRIWVCVSDDFDLKRIIRAIVACLGGRDSEELESLQRSLQQDLFRKRFLLVLDDVWNEDMEVWSKLKGILAGCGASGSSVIVTTRLETVASMMGTCPPHRLQALSEHDCWYLFKAYAFGPGNENTPFLKAIGKEIAAKSRGVPLAAKSLGGLLRSKRQVEEWAFRDQQLAPEKVTDSLKELMESFDVLAQDMFGFGMQRGMVQTRPETSPLRETISLLTEPKVYGRDEDTAKLVNLLCPYHHPRSQMLDKDMLVCPILGMGGLGKTTLAQLVYNDSQVVRHFRSRIWVCVSDDFDLKRIIRAIVACLGGRDSEELESLQRSLQQDLFGERFLLVLDDVWNEDMEVWSKLKGILAGCGASGSSVIVTTRLETVASMMGTCPPHRLQALSEHDCWSLFKTYAFGPGNEETPSLKAIGKEIVAKCGGVPLAIKSLGGLLRSKREVEEWLVVKESEIWELPQNENDISPALTLSYQNLPSVLKQCFVYCSIFPPDHKINRIELIRLWIANGLLQPSARSELEDVGNEAFDALLWRSFFQDAEEDEDGSILTCKMHDLMHDLACSMAKDECSVVDLKNARISPESRYRHVSLIFKQRPSSLTLGFAQSSSSSLRSLIWLDNYRLTTENCHSIFSNLIRLRALDLHKCLIEVVPDCIAEMIHLRYLNLSCTFIKSLPNSICGLNNIQTLILKRCSQLQSLPEDMRKMSSLRHLDIRECNRLSSMPSGLGQLHCLQTLSVFIVNPEGGCSISELERLNLGGELKIQKLENVNSSMDAQKAMLMGKNLLTLGLSWSHFPELQENSREVLEGLQPHSNVRRLFLEGYEGLTLPSWLSISNVPNLVEIQLSKCRCECLPPLWTLLHLRVLKIATMNCLKFIDVEVYNESRMNGFPSLEELSLSHMPSLEGWSLSSQGGDQEAAEAAGPQQLLFCSLKRLALKECPKLTQIPLSSSLQYVHMTKCNTTVLGSLRDLLCLSELKLVLFDELVNFPEGALWNLTSLSKLSIARCKNLKALPSELERLTALIELKIESCAELVSLGDGKGGLGNLSSLKILVIDSCHRLKRFPQVEKSSLVYLEISHCAQLEFSVEDFHNLVALQHLRLYRLPKLRCIPEGIQQAEMLRTLSVMHCSEDVMDLPDWIVTLTSLQELTIEGCKHRQLLPDEFHLLSSLRQLEIQACNVGLEKRCERHNGEDWFKIKDIPYVKISSKSY